MSHKSQKGFESIVLIMVIAAILVITGGVCFATQEPVVAPPINPQSATINSHPIANSQSATTVEQQITSTTAGLRSIGYKGIRVDVVIDKPENIKAADVLLAFHGTATYDLRIVKAAKTMLEETKKIIVRKDIIIISVAYPEEGLLFGDNIKEAEAVLLWTKYDAAKELGIKINKIYLFGHSQGGYLVTRLNTMYATDGVIANGPGPIDLSYECKLDETASSNLNAKGRKAVHNVCGFLKNKYGSVLDNPAPYKDRSLINFTSGYKSRILFIQGMKDKKTQMAEYPEFKEKVSRCTDCAPHRFLEIKDVGHPAAFESSIAIEAINNFLSH